MVIKSGIEALSASESFAAANLFFETG